MAKILDAKGTQVKTEAETKDNDFVNGERVLVVVSELDNKRGLKFEFGVKSLRNPLKLESFWKGLYKHQKDENLQIMVQSMVQQALNDIGKQMMEQQQVQQAIADAAQQIDKKLI